MKQIPHLVIWDWNGTLLNDVDLCVENFNDILKRHTIAPLSKPEFRNLYRHPVKEMYEDVGVRFSKNYTFLDLSVEWHDGYVKKTKAAKLFDDALTALTFFKSLGTQQMLCSALEHQSLSIQVNQYDVGSFFTQISGHHDLEAESKISRGFEQWAATRVAPSDTLLIGDSGHDLDLANTIGCPCALLNTGHQNLHGPNARIDASLHKNLAIFEDLQSLVDSLKSS